MEENRQPRDTQRSPKERTPVPGEGNMIYPDGDGEPEQGEVIPGEGLQEKESQEN